MNDSEAVRRLLAEYCHLCDDARYAEWAQLFTSDGSFTAFNRTHTGHEALAAFIATAPLGKHLCFNAVIDLEQERASCVSDFVFYTRAREIGSVGRYIDDLIRTEAGWRYASRRVEMMPGD